MTQYEKKKIKKEGTCYKKFLLSLEVLNHRHQSIVKTLNVPCL